MCWAVSNCTTMLTQVRFETRFSWFSSTICPKWLVYQHLYTEENSLGQQRATHLMETSCLWTQRALFLLETIYLSQHYILWNPRFLNQKQTWNSLRQGLDPARIFLERNSLQRYKHIYRKSLKYGTLLELLAFKQNGIQEEFTLSCFLIISFSMKMKQSPMKMIFVCACACVRACVYLVDTVRKSNPFWISVSLVWSISGHFINYTTTSTKTYLLFKIKQAICNVSTNPPPPEHVTSEMQSCWFTLCKVKKKLAHGVIYTYDVTKWQHSWLCFHNFQMPVFN